MTTHDTADASAARPGGFHPIDWIRAHPVTSDAMFAGLLTTIALGFHLVDSEAGPEETPTDPAWWTVVLVVLAMSPVAWRRSRPITVTLVVTVAQVLAAFGDVYGPNFLGVVIALYSLGAHAAGRQRSRTVAAVAVLTSTLFFIGVMVEEVTVGSLLSITILLVTSFVLGDNLRRRRDAADALQERLERAERERELMARDRVHAERARIARELHDVVAHSVSAMVIQAGAARRSLVSSPENAEAALGNIEQVGREAMNELRGVLGVLRRAETGRTYGADGASPASTPQPTLAGVDQLVAAATDLPITASIDADRWGVASGTDLAGYRVVQEALTNVRRHAGPVTSVTVVVSRGVDDISIEVSDDGRGAAADDIGHGYGTLGMRERVEAVGGRISAGPRPGGGWRVTAILPAPSRPVASSPSAETSPTSSTIETSSA